MISAHRAARLIERNAFAYRRQYWLFLTGFVEPVLFLLSIGLGVGELVGEIPFGGDMVSYKEFVAPGLLATSAMMGAVLDTTFNFFVKFKYTKTYDAVMATPLTPTDLAAGEIAWALGRGGIYAAGFLVTMLFFGLVASWWAILAIPVAVLIGFAFAGAGLAGSTYMRSFMDFDFVNMAIMPMFLFSATFFPVSQYPPVLEAIVRITPLYQGVVLERALILGDVHWSLLLNALYLAVMGTLGLRLAARRLRPLLQP